MTMNTTLTMRTRIRTVFLSLYCEPQSHKHICNNKRWSHHHRSLDILSFSPMVKEALASNAANLSNNMKKNMMKPVVALESTIISHGMPFPQNLETAIQVENIVKENGCIPATIAVMDGKLKIGLTESELLLLAEKGASNAIKTSRRDLAYVLSQKKLGATTVSGTMIASQLAGIPIFVTGGIGGVHRDAECSFDISADLTELGRSPVSVVCSGVKSILDIPKTLEYLETQGVSVVTFGDSDDFPAFYTRKSGFKSTMNLSCPKACAEMIRANHDLSLNSGIVFAVPIPEADQVVDHETMTKTIDQAISISKQKGIHGKEATPFLLKTIKDLTKGKSLQANIALVKNNAKIGSKIAFALNHVE